MKLYLRKETKNIEENKIAGNDRLPYFRLVVIPEDARPDNIVPWPEVGALWKTKSGKGGYNMLLAPGVEIKFNPLTPEQLAAVQATRKKSIDAGVEGIKADEINFD